VLQSDFRRVGAVPASLSLEPTHQARFFVSVIFQRFMLIEFIGRSVGLVGGSANPLRGTLRALATGLRLTIRCWSARSAVHQRIQRTDSVASKLALRPPLIRGSLEGLEIAC